MFKEMLTGVVRAFKGAVEVVKECGGRVAAGVTAAGTVAFATASHAQSVAPLDLSGTGTDIAGYIATAAGAGLAILAGIYGVKVIIRAFKSVK